MSRMKIIVLAAALVLIIGLFAGCGGEKADTLYKGGTIYTADEKDSKVEAVAVKDGKIIFTGTEADAEKFVGGDTETVDLKGKMMIPGMSDSHLHPPGTMATALYEIDLNGVLSEKATMKTIEEYVKKNPDMDVYYGTGFSIGAFKGMEAAKGPTKERLDKITDKPVIITSYDGHIAWLNSAAFKYCGIDKNTKPPKGGTIEKTDEGQLWGTLKELAQDLLKPQELTKKQKDKAYKEFFEQQRSLGYTGITSMSTGITSGELYEPFEKLDKDGVPKMYIFANTVMDPNKDIKEQMDTAVARREGYESETLKFGTLKFFADGVVEGVTGYLKEPYAKGAEKGNDFVSEPLWKPEQMKEAFKLAMENDFQIHVHSIGDAATAQTVASMEYAQKETAKENPRNIITHLQLVAPEDIKKFGELGIIANMQPYWAFKEPAWWEVVDEPFLGKRAEKEYPIKSFIDAGTKVVFSSDNPVTPVNNPFWAMEVGVTRNLNVPEYYEVDPIKDMDDKKWLLWPEERVSLEEAIKAFTINGAYQNYREDISGSIEVDKYADFAILNQDLFEINPIDISETKVLSTIFHGEEVYKADIEK
ncbi:MAG: amidohydrolase [Anaerovoracaceae bacterium]